MLTAAVPTFRIRGVCGRQVGSIVRASPRGGVGRGVGIVAKKALLLLVLAFVVFYILAQPEGAGDSAQSAAGAVGEGFQKMIRFFTALFS